MLILNSLRGGAGAVKLLVDAQPSVIGPLLEALDSNGDTPLAVAVFHCAKLDERNAESGALPARSDASQ